MAGEFISTVYSLVRNGKWAELHTYFKLIKEILDLPRGVVVPGDPQPKE